MLGDPEKVTVNAILVELGQMDLWREMVSTRTFTDFMRTAIRDRNACRYGKVDSGPQETGARLITPHPSRPGGDACPRGDARDQGAGMGEPRR